MKQFLIQIAQIFTECIVRAFDRSEVWTISYAESCIYIYSLENVNLNNLENGQLSQMKDKEMPLSFVYDCLMQSHRSIFRYWNLLNGNTLTILLWIGH